MNRPTIARASENMMSALSSAHLDAIKDPSPYHRGRVDGLRTALHLLGESDAMLRYVQVSAQEYAREQSTTAVLTA